MLAVQALMDASRDSSDNGYGECPICLEIMEKPYNTECDHTFCYECIVGLINSNNKSSAGCPMCRRTLTIKNIRAAPALIAPAVLSVPLVAPALLKAAGGTEGGKDAGLVPMDVVSDVTSDSLNALVVKPVAAAAGGEGGEGVEGEEAHVSILEDGLMTTKLRHLVSELRKVQTADSTAKCLVFSQFTQVQELSLTDTTSCVVTCDAFFYAISGPVLSCGVIRPYMITCQSSSLFILSILPATMIPRLLPPSSPLTPILLPHPLFHQQTLSWLQVELPKHGFSFRTLLGSMTMANRAKALADFQVRAVEHAKVYSTATCQLNSTYDVQYFIPHHSIAHNTTHDITTH